jgi:hypothetical protein
MHLNPTYTIPILKKFGIMKNSEFQLPMYYFSKFFTISKFIDSVSLISKK